MKKVFAGILSSLVIAAVCVIMAACSDVNIVGTWKFSKMSGEMNGLAVEYKVGDELSPGVKLTEDFFVLTIKEDNTFEMKMSAAASNSANGTWEEKDGKYYLTVEGNSVEITLSGNVLSLNQEGMRIELKK
jgi:hypothetical protein